METMKEDCVLKVLEKAELNQISLTGVRAVVLLGMLMEAPRTLEEIKKTFMELNLINTSNTDEIIRIDLNTLRAVGCDITRACNKTDNKYVLINNPYALNFVDEEIKILKKTYRSIKDNITLKKILSYDEFFRKLANSMNYGNMREKLLGISVLKDYDINLIEILQHDCEVGNVLKIVYKNPSQCASSEKEILAQRLVLQNDKVYLYCYDFLKLKIVMLNVKRILSVLSRTKKDITIFPKTIYVKFYLKNLGIETLSEYEKIIEKCDEGFVVEGHYDTEFAAIQRILSFGSKCTVLEPEEFKEIIIEKLRSIRSNYNGI